MTEFSTALFTNRSKTVTRVEVNKLQSTALEGGYSLKLVVFVGIYCQGVLKVLYVAHSFTELALGDVVCLAFAARDVLYFYKLKVDFLIACFVAVSALSCEVPIFVSRQRNFSKILHIACNL